MPIRLNLLAEAQAEEEMRRRDPVKRAIWAGALLVACLVAVYIVLLVMTMTKHAELSRIEARMDSNNTEYQQIADNEKKLLDNIHHLEALKQFAGKRFLWGNVLNAMQKSAVEDVQLIRFRGDQTYAATEEVKGKTSDNGRSTLGRPGYVTEKVTLTLDAKDNSATPGDRINKFKASLETAPFLGKESAPTNGATLTLKNLSAPSFDGENGKTVVLFSLECRLPDRTIITK